MAYNFNGSTDVISATITAVDTGDWTICAWIYPETAGESNQGTIVRAQSGALTRQGMLFGAAGTLRVIVTQSYDSNSAQFSSTNNGVDLNTWNFLAGTFDSSSVACAAYRGTLTSSVTALSQQSSTNGLGSRDTGGTALRIGNNTATTVTFDGSIEHVFFFKRLLSTAEMEQIRLGWRPAPDTTNLAAYYPLTADAKDRSGNSADGTVTGAVLASGFAPQLPSATVSADSLSATTASPSSLTATTATADSLTLTPA